jgi:mannose-6-phosphate isomerase-like protein (cupin superfamily)
MTTLIDTLNRFIEDANLYKDLIEPCSERLNVGIKLTDTDETATLVIGEEIEVVTGLKNPIVNITMSSSVLEKIVAHEADAFALAGRSRMDEVRPINFEFVQPERSAEAMELIKALGTFFLIPGRIKTKNLRLEFAGEAHGARPIPLVYWKGLRSAWYHVNAGSILNEEKEKDPWPQLFTVLAGKGKALVDDKELELVPNMVVYIPRNCIHQVIAEEDIELIWIAWDAV